jgi:CRISPR/Cas system CSM-associated protein Csm3 (group 7 of RAMP superfamily)
MQYEYIADIVLEAKTALSIGSGKNDETQDAPVQKDWNGMPIIFGTTTAGVLRHLYKEGNKDAVFGAEEDNNDQGSESRLILSNGLLLYRNREKEKDEVVECVREKLPDFFDHYRTLPIRQHTAINDKGTAVEKSKHDQEIVYAGSRFKLRVSLLCESDSPTSKTTFESILGLFYDEEFRIGSKTTAGLGNLKPITDTIKYACLDRTSDAYCNLSASLNQDEGIFDLVYKYQPQNEHKRFADYSLHLSPEDFFIFGSGFGSEDDSIDQVFKVEQVVDYDRQTLATKLLIPASSVKGSLSHRTAFHYNRRAGNFADKINTDKFEEHLGENNLAIKAIFGAKSKIENNIETGRKGKIIIDDTYIEVYEQKVFDHIKIDDFTMAVVGGAKFDEMVASICSFKMKMMIDEEGLTEDIKGAFGDAIDDLKNGRLTLGGMSSRGHGVFKAAKGEENA